MTVTVKKLPNCLASVRVEIPGDDRTAEREKILRNYTRHAALPGFRKGKVPRSVIEKRFGADIEKELTEKLIDEGLSAAVKQENLRVLSVQSWDTDDEATDETRYTLTLDIVLAPEIELPDYKGLAISVPKIEVADSLIDNAVGQQREKMANIVAVERPAEMGDLVSIDYRATLDGQPVKELVPEAQSFIAENNNYMMKLDDRNFLPGFAGQLTGATKGESREVTIKFPEDGAPEAIAGKDVVYAVTVLEVHEAQLPEANDEFAARLVPGKNMEEVRGLIRESLTAQAQQKDMEQKRVAAMVALREKVDFDLPENVLHNATEQRISQLVRMNLDRGITDEDIVENEQQIVDAASAQAKIDVKDEFILMEIVRREKIEVTQQDMIHRISHIAQSSQTSVDRVVKTLKKNNGLQNVRQSILLGKALDVLVEHANVTYTAPAPVELTTDS